MLNNNQFLEVIRKSFATYLNVGTSRSTAKLKTLHGHIAKDLAEILGTEYSIKSQGVGDDKEGTITGRYYPKKVDITVYHKETPVAGYAVKFVMRNYFQNSNNYFENMLGETANIRSKSIPYFQIFIIFDKIPYYKNGGQFKHYESISQHQLEKYLILSKDNPNIYYHVPDKTLILLLSLKEKETDYPYINSEDYANYYKSVINDENLICYSNKIEDKFNNSVILNDYSDFIKRTYYIILGNEKN